MAKQEAKETNSLRFFVQSAQKIFRVFRVTLTNIQFYFTEARREATADFISSRPFFAASSSFAFTE